MKQRIRRFKGLKNNFSTTLSIALSAVLLIVLLVVGIGGFSLGKMRGSEEELGREISSSSSLSSSAENVLDEDSVVLDESGFFTESSDGIRNVDFNRDSNQNFSEEEKINIRVYENYNEAVVNITTEVIGYNWFLEAVPSEGASGSGAIIDKRGYVLTNNHVVEKAYKVFITMADGVQFEGSVLGHDRENDLAVIKFDPKDRDLKTIPFGYSKNLKVGQKVLAIGNPYGLERTLTTGIVSGLGRPIKNRLGLIIQNMIQTDASINPGNSGGPLLNIKGEMIGINTMIYSPTGGSVGIGFAVPVDTARRVVPDLINYGEVKRGWIEIVPIQLFPSLVRYGKLPVSKGILISEVKPNGNAEKAGLVGGLRSKAVRSRNGVIYLGGDIIIRINDKPIESISSYYGALESTKPGETVKVTVIRGKKEKTVKMKLTERPDNYLGK